ncbi:unnamed protein product [Danaus chrysippus]|uniref:(African queen) hypothetical protein n=1 Tax=Danaus chrysippus TaxID=151541 RepID=A0A8J2W2L6_9NEOP|nr:unnamed protein product [Danaus chrysippus]
MRPTGGVLFKQARECERVWRAASPLHSGSHSGVSALRPLAVPWPPSSSDNWKRVENHVKKLNSRPRLEIDPECLRWTPLLTPTINPFRSPDENSADQDTENDEGELKTESEKYGNGTRNDSFEIKR